VLLGLAVMVFVVLISLRIARGGDSFRWSPSWLRQYPSCWEHTCIWQCVYFYAHSWTHL